MSVGDRGKYAEKKFVEFLKEQAKNPLFDWDRIPDARTARGRIGKRKGDFYIFYKSTSYLVELKECQHDYRMPTKRLTQLPKMLRFAMTGNTSIAVIYHSERKKWRVIPMSFLRDNKQQPSYNFTGFPAFGSLENLWKSVCDKRYMFRSQNFLEDK